MLDKQLLNGAMNNLLIAMKVIEKNSKYFMKPSKYEFAIENKIGIIKNINSIFNERTSIEAISLKLVHNLSMLVSFSSHFDSENNSDDIFDRIFYEFSEDSKFQLKIGVYPDIVKIENRKGFGIFFYKTLDMSACLAEFPHAVNRYLSKMKSENQKFKEFEKVTNFFNEVISKGCEPNLAMSLFIGENSEMFDKYLDK